MPAIREQTWDEVQIYTWGDLLEHQWMDFRIALGTAEPEADAQGVNIKQVQLFGEALAEAVAQGVNVKHAPVIGVAIGEGFVSVVVAERNYKSAMLSYLPLYERQSRVFDIVFAAIDKEFRRLEHRNSIIKLNRDIDTAIEALPIYERDLGIKTNKHVPHAQRREMIKAKFRSAFDQTTEEQIKEVAAAFSNGEVEVLRTDTPGVYQIKFIGTKGIPANMDGLMQAIDDIVPAHLQFDYVYTYNVWGFLTGKTWGEVEHLTWEEIQVWNGGM